MIIMFVAEALTITICMIIMFVAEVLTTTTTTEAPPKPCPECKCDCNKSNKTDKTLGASPLEQG